MVTKPIPHPHRVIIPLRQEHETALFAFFVFLEDPAKFTGPAFSPHDIFPLLYEEWVPGSDRIEFLIGDLPSALTEVRAASYLLRISARMQDKHAGSKQRAAIGLGRLAINLARIAKDAFREFGEGV